MKHLLAVKVTNENESTLRDIFYHWSELQKKWIQYGYQNNSL